MLIKSIQAPFYVKNKAIKKYYGDDFLKYLVHSIKVHQVNLFFTSVYNKRKCYHINHVTNTP